MGKTNFTNYGWHYRYLIRSRFGNALWCGKWIATDSHHPRGTVRHRFLVTFPFGMLTVCYVQLDYVSHISVGGCLQLPYDFFDNSGHHVGA